MKFLKNQIYKILIYILILAILSLIGYSFKIESSILANVSSFITFIFVIILQKTWLEDYKSELDKKLETHKAKLSGYTLVTKLQYELEFKIYIEIHGLVESHFRIVSDMIFQIENNKIKDKSGLIKKYEESHEKILSNMYKNKPFYQKEICNKISIISSLNSEIFYIYIDFSEGDLIKVELAKKGRDIGDTLEELSDLIRERIENMKIVE
jgi:hypothetical protein|nr:MAG TPA: hypothetical protein [Caudoviricetes sp.]